MVDVEVEVLQLEGHALALAQGGHATQRPLGGEPVARRHDRLRAVRHTTLSETRAVQVEVRVAEAMGHGHRLPGGAQQLPRPRVRAVEQACVPA